ncbi:hypothetical protein [Methanobacterium sp.]|uniref:hypothetical protein n=1 Tax=Methanobacterium sp. TaxID=2164 RepID=UPI0025E72334|nr:hypothetical protein [Methanobacterium sp.]MBI5460422.1 hypothetical protein [Methanobacterium sp.]
MDLSSLLPNLLVERLLGFILGLILFYAALKLLNELKNKEIAISMVFLHKNRMIIIFSLLFISGLLSFVTGLIYVFIGNGIYIERLLNLNAVVLLIFVVSLQRIMKGGK